MFWNRTGLSPLSRQFLDGFILSVSHCKDVVQVVNYRIRNESHVNNIFQRLIYQSDHDTYLSSFSFAREGDKCDYFGWGAGGSKNGGEAANFCEYFEKPLTIPIPIFIKHPNITEYQYLIQ